MVHDVQIFNGIESFMAHADMDGDAELAAKMMNWLPKYDKSIPFKGSTFLLKSFNKVLVKIIRQRY